MPYERELEREVEELDNRGLPPRVSKRIREFIQDTGLQGISPGRRYAYIIRLRKIASMIPSKFLNPSEKDIKSLMVKISSTKVKWGSGEAHLPTENSVKAYQVTLKKFYKWHLGNGKSYPECVEWIRIGNGHPSKEMKPEYLISKEEVNKLIEASENARDKALFSTLYDSGVRIGELLTMKIRDLEFDDYGAILSVSGKTGFRQVRVIGDSIPYLRSWLNVHPTKADKDSWLFCKISEDVKGKELNHYDVYSIMRKVSRRAGFVDKDGNAKRRIHPHLFRHTRATILASKVVEAPLEAQMGWVHGSKQTKTYVHLSRRDQDNAILKAYGIEVKEEDTIKEEVPKECPRCHQKNPSNFIYCGTCGLPLDIKTAIQLDEKRKEVESKLIGSSAVDNSTKELLKTFDPEFKDKLLEAVLSQIVSNPQLRDKFTREIEGRQ
jgi:integrase